MASWNETHPSLRQLAVAADVTVPTLRHYFGSRDDLIEAVFTEYRRLGEPYLAESAEPKGDLKESVSSYLADLLRAMTQDIKMADLFAVGLTEGMLNRRLGPAYLDNMTDPLIDALEARLASHQRRGEMAEGDPRNAALLLISPVIIACHHQYQMNGRCKRPLDMDSLIEDAAVAFVRAYGANQGASVQRH